MLLSDFISFFFGFGWGSGLGLDLGFAWTGTFGLSFPPFSSIYSSSYSSS